MAVLLGNPRVGEHLCGSQPSLRVSEEKTGDEVLGGGRDGGPGDARELKVTSSDGNEQLALAL